MDDPAEKIQVYEKRHTIDAKGLSTQQQPPAWQQWTYLFGVPGELRKGRK